MRKYYGTNGKVLEVLEGLGRWWIVGYKKGSAHKSLKSPACPPRLSKEEAQQDLDAYAVKKGLREVMQ